MPVVKIRCIRASVNLQPRLFREIFTEGTGPIRSLSGLEIAAREASFARASPSVGEVDFPRSEGALTAAGFADDRPPCRAAVALRSLERGRRARKSTTRCDPVRIG